ncbi:hypothetical protein CBI38_28965 [Rhodococcus oxybenzonivorans]|uniref:Uncharacterized protein n=1 Tax=Rhodococcus oxybenzonivorans TaxID=1990687 RepID=A0A2S2C271_9NOCA|nr:hypothetical protein CBI38_28965 [Rhodococcus oxybenzonivorans]
MAISADAIPATVATDTADSETLQGLDGVGAACRVEIGRVRMWCGIGAFDGDKSGLDQDKSGLDQYAHRL